MCVIMIVQDTVPTRQIVRDCWDSNAFGAGVAWREHETVRWSKGQFQTADDVYELIMALPTPYIVHFRIPTVGDTCDELCHPFPLGGSLDLTGSSTEGVVAHNGHWACWQAAMLKFLGVTRIPDGPWSDSRAMAWIVNQSGPGFLSLVDNAQRIVLFTPSHLTRFGRWHLDRGIWFSNMTWSISAPLLDQLWIGSRSQHREDPVVDDADCFDRIEHGGLLPYRNPYRRETHE
jgi:hypothetical protein